MEQSTKRTVGLFGAICISIGITIGASIFAMIPTVVSLTGTGACLAYFLAGIVNVFGAIAATQVAGVFPVTGGAFMANAIYTRPSISAATSMATIFGLAATVCFNAYAAAAYVQLIFPGVNPMIFCIVVILIFCVMNVLGIKLMSWIQTAMMIFLFAIIAVFFIGGFKVSNPANLTSMVPAGVGNLGMATGIAVFSWLGICTVCNYAGEIKNPQRNVPRALVWSICILAAIYILTAFVFSGAMSMEAIGAAGETAAIDVAGMFLPNAAVTIIVVGIILAILTTVNGLIMLCSREMVAWGNQKVMPEICAKINPKTGVPTYNIIIFMVFSILFSLLAAKAQDYALIVIIPVMLYQINQCFAVNRLVKKDPEAYEKASIKVRPGLLKLALIGSLVLCTLVCIFTYLAGSTSAIIGVGLAVAAFLYYQIRKAYLKKKGVDLDEAAKLISEETQAEINNA